MSTSTKAKEHFASDGDSSGDDEPLSDAETTSFAEFAMNDAIKTVKDRKKRAFQKYTDSAKLKRAGICEFVNQRTKSRCTWHVSRKKRNSKYCSKHRSYVSIRRHSQSLRDLHQEIKKARRTRDIAQRKADLIKSYRAEEDELTKFNKINKQDNDDYELEMRMKTLSTTKSKSKSHNTKNNGDDGDDGGLGAPPAEDWNELFKNSSSSVPVPNVPVPKVPVPSFPVPSVPNVPIPPEAPKSIPPVAFTFPKNNEIEDELSDLDDEEYMEE